MKQKYYLRGLGIGILITALVFIFTGPSELSDDEIIKRAEELGYVKEDKVTPSLGIKELLETGTPTPTVFDMPENTPVPTSVPEPTSTNTPMPTPTEEPTPTPEPTPTIKPTSTPVPQNTVTPTPEPTITIVPTSAPEENVSIATIVVERGDTATVVCNKIEAAGILEDGSILRRYLMNNDLTDFINIGSYTLSGDMSVEEMADILTRR